MSFSAARRISVWQGMGRERVRGWLVLALWGGLTLETTASSAAIWPTVAVKIERELASEDVAVRRRAARQLSELSGTQRTRVITHALGDSDLEVKLLAAQAARVQPVPGLAERVSPWLTDPDARVRLSAAETLVEVPSVQAVPALVRALSDSEPSVRRAAAAALAEARDAQAVTGLLGRLDDSAVEVRDAVVRSLARLGDARAVVPLISKIEDPAPAVRQSVARALGELGDSKAVSALVLSLRDPEALVRREALIALGELGEARVVPSIASLLPTEAQATVRRAAVDALSRLPSAPAVAALISTLASFPEERERIVRALGRLEALALPGLTNCVRAAADVLQREACAVALAQSSQSAQQVAAAAAVRGAFQASAIGAEIALPSLARLRDPEALSTSLAFLTDADPGVRRAALEATSLLLSPEQPDGRAVEPLELAFERSRRQRGERLELLRLLGRTGAARAARLLEPIARHADDLEFRVVALSALADLGVPSAAATFLGALQDPEARVRLAAALAIRRGRAPGLALQLLDRLEIASSQDREALALALPGAISAEVKVPAKLVERLAQLLSVCEGGERDALIEALAATQDPAVSPILARLLESPAPADRAKLMESLARRSDARAAIERGLLDADAAVRANAAWSAGSVLNEGALPALSAALRDRDVAVASNAAAALARLGQRTKRDVRGVLCSSLADARSAVRANALAGLRLLGARCSGAPERRALERDRAPRVRQAAAALLRDVPAEAALDAKALRRCAAEEATASVALTCMDSRQQPPGTGARALLVFVVPEFATSPVPRAAFALRRPDGLVRNGQSDRRGAVYEGALSDGPVELGVLAAFEE